MNINNGLIKVLGSETKKNKFIKLALSLIMLSIIAVVLPFSIMKILLSAFVICGHLGLLIWLSVRFISYFEVVAGVKKILESKSVKTISRVVVVMLVISNVVTLLYAHQIRNTKEQMAKDIVVNTYYAEETLINAMKEKGVNMNGKSTLKAYDEYVIRLVLEDLNQYENKYLANFNRYFSPNEMANVKKNLAHHGSQVTYKNIPHVAAYVKFENFAKDVTYKQFEAFIPEINQHNQLIIDLRGNSGGYLAECYQVLSAFFDEGTTLFQMKSVNDQAITSKTDRLIKVEEILILTDEKTASAAEVVVAVLQASDLKVNTLGYKTVGKYFSYALHEFNDKSGIMLVNSEIADQKGVVINKEGLIPGIDLSLETSPQDQVASKGLLISDDLLEEGLKLFYEQ